MTIPRVSLPLVTSARTAARWAVALVLIGATLTVLGGCSRNEAAEIDTAAGEIQIAKTPVVSCEALRELKALLERNQTCCR